MKAYLVIMQTKKRVKRKLANQVKQQDGHLASGIKRIALVLFLVAGIALPSAYCLLPTAQASDPGTTDWPMWGGTADRNMVSNMKGIPTIWDVKEKKNVKWVAQLGSQTYGNV